MKKRFIDVIVVFIVILFFLTSILNFNTITVNKHDVRKGKLENIARISGQIESKTYEVITYGKDCVVIENMTSEGELIKIGDPIFRIDTGYDLITVDTEKDDVILKIEKEKLNVSSQSGEKLNIERRKLNLIEEELNKLVEVYNNEKKLFEAGVINELQLNNSKAAKDAKNLQYQEAKLVYDENLEIGDITEKEALIRLNGLEKKLKYLKLKEESYAQIDENGIYHSEFNGVIVTMPELNSVTLKSEDLVEIAVVDNFTSYLFVGKLDLEYYDMVNVGDEIEFYDDVIYTPIMGRITKKYNIVEDGKIRIEAEFIEERSAKLGYGKDFSAWRVKRSLAEIMIPKSAVITNQIIKEGDTVEIFKIEDGEKGEPVAKLISVVVEHVGDNNISVDTESVDGLIKHVILNPSYKVKDGVKIKW